MFPSEKPSLTVQAVWAYSLISRAASRAQAECHPARITSSARITAMRVTAFPLRPDAPTSLHGASRANGPCRYASAVIVCATNANYDRKYTRTRIALGNTQAVGGGMGSGSGIRTFLRKKLN